MQTCARNICRRLPFLHQPKHNRSSRWNPCRTDSVAQGWLPKNASAQFLQAGYVNVLHCLRSLCARLQSRPSLPHCANQCQCYTPLTVFMLIKKREKKQNRKRQTNRKHKAAEAWRVFSIRAGAFWFVPLDPLLQAVRSRPSHVHCWTRRALEKCVCVRFCILGCALRSIPCLRRFVLSRQIPRVLKYVSETFSFSTTWQCLQWQCLHQKRVQISLKKGSGFQVEATTSSCPAPRPRFPVKRYQKIYCHI